MLLKRLSLTTTALGMLAIFLPTSASIAQQSKQLNADEHTTAINQVVQVNRSQNSGAWLARHGMTSSQYQSEFNKHTRNGYSLVQVSGYGVRGKAYYAAIWHKRSGAKYIARHGMTGSQYQSEFNKHTQNGYRLTLVDGYSVGNKAYYAAIWEKRNGPAYIARHGMSSSRYQSEFNKHTQNGYRLMLVEGYGVGNKVYYAAIWEKRNGPAYIARHGMSSSQYQSEFNKHTKNGYRLTHVSGYNVGNKDFYAAIWEKKEGSNWVARHRMTSKNYQCEFDNYYYQGYRPKLVSGYAKGNSARYAAIWESSGAWKSADVQHIDKTINSFMKANQVPGAALAITKNGRLVFAKGYGYANKEKREKTCATSLFRIASVSKPITSVAIMKLVEEGKLKLSDKVFGSGAILGNTYGSKPYSAREKSITVAQLLEHTAGGNEWDNNKKPASDTTGDPMFAKISYNHKQLIGWVLDNRKIDVTPGSSYNYSNFGYSILGRIVKRLTGQSYQSYVRNKIFQPAGVKDMYIAGDTKEDKRPNEVIYYNDDAYKWPVKRMDSHGGWIASPVDLMRFMVRVDGFNTKPDILKPSTIQTMTTSTLGNGYTKGWRVNSSNNWWHSGLLPGTRSIIVRTDKGYSWTLLVNSSNGNGSLDKTMWEVINGIKNWPSHDLF